MRTLGLAIGSILYQLFIVFLRYAFFAFNFKDDAVTITPAMIYSQCSEIHPKFGKLDDHNFHSLIY